MQLVDNPNFKTFMEEIKSTLNDYSCILIACDSVDKRAVLAGRAQALTELINKVDSTREEYNRMDARNGT